MVTNKTKNVTNDNARKTIENFERKPFLHKSNQKCNLKFTPNAKMLKPRRSLGKFNVHNLSLNKEAVTIYHECKYQLHENRRHK